MGKVSGCFQIAFIAIAVLGCERKTSTTSKEAAAVPGVAMEDFESCYPQGTGLARCLTAKSKLPAGWAQSDFDSCLTAANPTALDSAMCMTSRGHTIFHHRMLLQSDLDKCSSKVGLSRLAGCLNKNGVLPTTLTQTQINTCVTALGGTATGLEKCLRKNAFIPRKPGLFQSDVAFCDKIDGRGAIAQCLINSDLAFPALTQANVDGCITAVGFDLVTRCLRNNRLSPNALMQAHVNVCSAAAGSGFIAGCLDSNGLLEGGTQANFDTCVTNVGVSQVAQCLRTGGFIPNQLLQAHATSCAQAAGEAGVLNCLTANGLLTGSPGVNQSEVADCIAKSGAGGLVRCLALKKLVTDFPVQAHFNGCNRYGGQANLASCLNGSGVLLPGLMQAQFDQCITAVGLANITTCLRNNGFIQTYSQLIGAGGVFAVRCASCHNATLLRGMMNIAVFASVSAKVVPFNPTASVMNDRINNAAMPMPPTGLIPQAERDRIFTWINQGARNN